MTNLKELAFSSIVVDIIRSQSHADKVADQLPAEGLEVLGVQVDELHNSFELALASVINTARVDGVWTDLSDEGACVRAFVVAGDRP